MGSHHCSKMRPHCVRLCVSLHHNKTGEREWGSQGQVKETRVCSHYHGHRHPQWKLIYTFSGVLAQDDATSKLCEGKTSGEMFRLKAGKQNCRDVVQCTASVRVLQ